jgi:flagellar biosynthesis protein
MTANFKSKPSLAVGLCYEHGKDVAPTIAIKGQNLSAETIIKIAQRYGVPVVKKSELTKVLSNLSIDQKIPGQLFEAVAQVMIQIDKKLNR